MKKRNIKAEILVCARQLFNERGYNMVSMRDIADALNISVGNLTYHYKKKEDLIEAVVTQIHSERGTPPPMHSLEELNDMLTRMSIRLSEDVYYFGNYPQLVQTCPNIRRMHMETMKAILLMLEKTMRNLNQEGLLLNEAFPGQYKHLSQAMVIVCTYWLSQSRVAKEQFLQADFKSCVWSLVYPLLSEKGKAVHKGLMLENAISSAV